MGWSDDGPDGMNHVPVLRSQEECIEHLKALIYKQPAAKRSWLKKIWEHLYG